MYKLIVAITITLTALVASAENKTIVITDWIRAKVICVDGMKFLVTYGLGNYNNRDSYQAISTVQILDKNGKPKECAKPAEDE